MWNRSTISWLCRGPPTWCYPIPDRGHPGSACNLQGLAVHHNQSYLVQYFKFLEKFFSHTELNQPPGNISLLIFTLYLYRERDLFHLKFFSTCWPATLLYAGNIAVNKTNADFFISLLRFPQDQPQTLEDGVHIPNFPLF